MPTKHKTRRIKPSPAPSRRRSTTRPKKAEPPPEVEPWDPVDGPDARTLIDRRQLPRTCYPTHAYLAPADDAGATRPPVIRVRDFNQRGLGFRARVDLSALDEAVLRLPVAANRVIALACRVRRSMELGNGWFDGLVEFLQPQPNLTVRDGQLHLVVRHA